MKISAVMLLALFAPSLPGCTRTAVLHQPPPVSFVSRSTDEVEAAILAGARKRKWIPTKVRDGVIDATLYLRTHVAVVRIEYGADSFTVRYLRSEQLNYKRRKDGTEVIHPNYNSWVRNLINDILMEL